ncbi:hypothetical protein MMAD_18130 [Mycolicibacterium madagascariense]|uniref:Uncharacterized protein n=1 Tax=Mycolicibacterium madagascariense TaxID=212765 RepID=A0A7I7XEL0_9MYCO|nr:hypothetical protein [Mycolicibacterium madagascariense]MCV7015225.1 hypothetical protein [Mycolicibacterium madagascariense]BBZ27518.1 hypothetical protein MMAD_18130 [Mycolicibacterium madagascariense]
MEARLVAFQGETNAYNLGIHQIGRPDWDIDRVHGNRKREAEERRVWNDQRKVTQAADERGLGSVLRQAEPWGRDSGIDWGAFNGRLLKLLQDNVVASLDDVETALADFVPDAANLTPTDDEEPHQPAAARTAPAGYTPGQSEQSDGGGEVSQDGEEG